MKRTIFLISMGGGFLFSSLMLLFSTVIMGVEYANSLAIYCLLGGVAVGLIMSLLIMLLTLLPVKPVKPISPKEREMMQKALEQYKTEHNLKEEPFAMLSYIMDRKGRFLRWQFADLWVMENGLLVVSAFMAKISSDLFIKRASLIRCVIDGESLTIWLPKRQELTLYFRDGADSVKIDRLVAALREKRFYREHDLRNTGILFHPMMEADLDCSTELLRVRSIPEEGEELPPVYASDSLYIHFADSFFFKEHYGAAFAEKGVYHPPKDTWSGFWFYDRSETQQILYAIQKDQPPGSEQLIPWLETTLDTCGGFAIYSADVASFYKRFTVH